MANGSGYTHRAWREEMQLLTGEGLRTMLGEALEHMHGGLVLAGVASEHEDFSEQCKTLVADLAVEGDRILGNWQPRAQRMGDAVAAAGGMAAEKKEYHQQ